MKAPLFIAPTIPLNADGSVDQRYKLLRTLNAALPTYGGQVLLHGQPGAPPPANVSLVVHDGVLAWSWGDIIADHPVLANFLLRSLWTEADGTHDGTVRDRINRGAAVLTIIGDNLPAHGWLGDGL